MFLQAAEMSGMKAQFDLPGFTATILAPSDAAFTTFLNGTASQYVELVVPILVCMLKCYSSPLPRPLPLPPPMPLPLGPVLIPPCLFSFSIPFLFQSF